MKPLKVLVSLIAEENDYQREQAATALATARGTDVSVKTAFTGNDAVN